jgi:methyl-accepting chemotaxis protein
MINSLQATAQNAVTIMSDRRVCANGSVENADRASNALNEINLSVNVISSMASQIATAAEEQSHIMQEVLVNITTIKNVVDNTSTEAQQNEARAKRLKSHSELLGGRVSTFKL